MNHTAPDAWLGSLNSRFAADNATLVAPTCDLLRSIIPAPATHARFLNSLSLLEHMGGYKIMATQHGPAISQSTLKHIAEEARHAFFFKRKAEQVAGRPLAYAAADLLSPAAARAYFQRLEANVKAAFAPDVDRQLIYLHMSLVVEFRAVWSYRLYQRELEQASAMLSLKGLLAEEEGHMGDVTRRIAAIGELDFDRMIGFCAIERRLFERMIDGFDRVVALPYAA